MKIDRTNIDIIKHLKVGVNLLVRLPKISMWQKIRSAPG